MSGDHAADSSDLSWPDRSELSCSAAHPVVNAELSWTETFNARTTIERLELRSSWLDEEEAALRSDAAAVMADIHALHPGAASFPEQQTPELGSWQSELEEEARQIGELRSQIGELRSGKGLLKSSLNAPAGIIPPHPNDSIPFLYGDTLETPGAPSLAVAASAGGQYIAIASWKRVLLCEESDSGLGVEAIGEYRPPSPAISDICFACAEIDSSALLVASGDLCIGWDLKTSDSLTDAAIQEAKESDGSSHPEWYETDRESFQHIWMRVRALSTIIALSMTRSAWQVILLLGTEANCIELYDLYSKSLTTNPTFTLTHRISTDGIILASALTDMGSMVWALCRRPGRSRFNALCVWHVNRRQQVCDRATYWKVARTGEATPGSLSNCMSHSEAQALLALGTYSGDVHVYRTNKVGSAVANARTLDDALRLTGDETTGVWWEHSEPVVAFCGDNPLLAVGSPAWVVLVYQYRASTTSTQLELVSSLRMCSSASNYLGLAWAPKSGVLWACYDREIQFWMRDAVNFCPTCNAETDLPEPLTGICPDCQSLVSLKDKWTHGGSKAASVVENIPADAMDKVDIRDAELLNMHLDSLAEPVVQQAEDIEDLSDAAEQEEPDMQHNMSLLFCDEEPM